MLFENFFEDSHGNERSAGVMDVPVQEFCHAIVEAPSFQNIKRSIWLCHSGELCIFYNNGQYIYALPTPEELETFRKLIPQIPHY